MRSYVVPILEAGSVDLVLTGHMHQYERSFLLDGDYSFSSAFSSSMKIDGTNGYPVPYFKPGLNPHEGTVYTLAGSSGRDEDPASFGHTTPSTAVRIQNFGSVVIDVNGDEFDVSFLRDTGVIADGFRLRKGTQ